MGTFTHTHTCLMSHTHTHTQAHTHTHTHTHKHIHTHLATVMSIPPDISSHGLRTRIQTHTTVLHSHGVRVSAVSSSSLFAKLQPRPSSLCMRAQDRARLCGRNATQAAMLLCASSIRLNTRPAATSQTCASTAHGSIAASQVMREQSRRAHRGGGLQRAGSQSAPALCLYRPR